MCLLAVLWRVVDDAPLIVAANREEAYARGGTPPQVLDDGVRFVAGVDPTAGGTWFGVNRHGLLISVTNRKKSRLPDHPRSRGLLVRELFQCRTAPEAASKAVQELDKHRYAGCNLVFADVDHLFVLHAGDWLRLRPLSPGIHVLTSGELNDLRDGRAAYALEWLSSLSFKSGAEWIAALKALCSQGQGEDHPPICLRGEQGGTVSSSLVALRKPLVLSNYHHSQGPPDRFPYEDHSHLLQRLV